MRNRSTNELFQAITGALADQNVSIERITLLGAVLIESHDARGYLEDMLSDEDEEGLKAIFGEKKGAYLNEIFADGDGDPGCAVDELLCMNGWLIKAETRPPDPKHVRFKNGRPSSWTSSYSVSGHFYHSNLTTALCKALLWGFRVERRAFARAKQLQAEAAAKGEANVQ